jgi:L-ascorbate metabolism protein UlaG (beta-lactamase superfamily)
MKKISLIVALCAVLSIGIFVVRQGGQDVAVPTRPAVVADDSLSSPRANADVRVVPIAHATMVLYFGDVVVYVDPVGGREAFASETPPSMILVTDIHGDHLSTSTLASIIGEKTTLIVPRAVHEKLTPELQARARILANGETWNGLGLEVLAMPMYNLPDVEDARHAKGRGNGYVLTSERQRVYIAGDTAGIPEMRALTGIDVAFVPMNLPYTMSVEEAADAVLAFKPSRVYPYHYRTPGGFSDVEKFKSLVNAGNPSIEVSLEKWY